MLNIDPIYFLKAVETAVVHNRCDMDNFCEMWKHARDCEHLGDITDLDLLHEYVLPATYLMNYGPTAQKAIEISVHLETADWGDSIALAGVATRAFFESSLLFNNHGISGVFKKRISQLHQAVKLRAAIEHLASLPAGSHEETIKAIHSWFINDAFNTAFTDPIFSKWFPEGPTGTDSGGIGDPD